MEAYSNPSENGASGITRGTPEVSESRKALVEKLCAAVRQSKSKHEPAFTRMREDMRFTRKQLPEETSSDDRAKVNIVQRHVGQRVASLYAKNPTFVAQRRKRMDFKVWDGKRASLEQAAMSLQGGAGAMQDPNTAMLLMDVQEGMARRQMLDSVGKTLELVLDYALDEQQPSFKAQAKQVVRRATTCGVGYFKLAYQRTLKKRPDIEAKLADITDRLATIERLQADIADGEKDENSAEAEELRQALNGLKSEPDVVVREGLVFDFPAATRVIPLGPCRQLAAGFPGAWGVAEEFAMSCDEIKETYGVDIGSNYTGYTPGKNGGFDRQDGENKRALIWEIYHRKDGLLYRVCDGYPDFLEEPAPPPLGYLEAFFPFFPLVFNQVEDEEELFPESDVRLLRNIQKEINRKREAVRQHRIASRPLYLARKGAVESEEEAINLGGHAAHDVVQLQGLEQNEDVGKVFQPFPKVGVDPNLYETGTDLTDMQLVVGAQEANLGGTSGDSATETSIAEGSRMTSIASNVDDLDDCLSAVGRAAGQVLLREMSQETVAQIAGPGAVWPELSAQQLAEEVFIEIEAGSSGRPNRDRELAAFERVAPFLLQTPGINPEWLARTQIKLLDARVDLEEAFTFGLPSITTMNRQSQVGTGDPATDPNQQGGEGGDNAQGPDQGRGGAQAAYPAGGEPAPNMMG